MNKKALMLMSARDKGEKGRRVGVEYEDWGVNDHSPMTEPYSGGYGPSSGRYPMEDKFRDRRGREHYNDGRYAPMSMMEPEDRGYRRYSDGRFDPRSNMDRRYSNEPMDDYNNPWMSRRMTPTYDDGGTRRMNPIGFARDMGGSDATMPRYQEMDRMDGGRPMQGYSFGEYMPRFDRQMAEEWASNMENEDGTRGPHWSMEQAKQVMAQKEIGGSPLAFYTALNMMYSDYSKVAKKLGLNTVDFYTCMAEAFLNDKDAVGGGGGEKLARYYEYVVQH